MKAAFYRSDYQKLLMCPLIKRLDQAQNMRPSLETLKRVFETLARAFKDLSED